MKLIKSFQDYIARKHIFFPATHPYPFLDFLVVPAPDIQEFCSSAVTSKIDEGFGNRLLMIPDTITAYKCLTTHLPKYA